jgi:hypothetical protein
MILGNAGTGKTRTMKAMVWYWIKHGKARQIAQSAYTGKAALAMKVANDDVSNATVCKMYKINPNNPARSAATNKEQMEEAIGTRLYHLIDELSFIDLPYWYTITERIKRSTAHPYDCTGPIGDRYMTILGDLSQHTMPQSKYPPYAQNIAQIARSNHQALNNISFHAAQGAHFLQSIQTCVVLTEQMRQATTESGRDLHEVAQRFMDGTFNLTDLQKLNNRCINYLRPEDVNSTQLRAADCIVFRNREKMMLNDIIVRQRAQDQGQQLFICKAPMQQIQINCTSTQGRHHTIPYDQLPAGIKATIDHIINTTPPQKTKNQTMASGRAHTFTISTVYNMNSFTIMKPCLHSDG